MYKVQGHKLYLTTDYIAKEANTCMDNSYLRYFTEYINVEGRNGWSLD